MEEDKNTRDELDSIRRRMHESDDKRADILSSILEMKAELMSELHSMRKEQVAMLDQARAYTDITVVRWMDECRRSFIQMPSASVLLTAKIGCIVGFVMYVAIAALGYAPIDPKTLFGLLK